MFGSLNVNPKTTGADEEGEGDDIGSQDSYAPESIADMMDQNLDALN